MTVWGDRPGEHVGCTGWKRKKIACKTATKRAADDRTERCEMGKGKGGHDKKNQQKKK